MAQPEAGEDAHRPGRSGSAQASRTCRWARRPCATRRSRARSSGAAFASYSESSPLPASSGRPPPGPGGQVDDLAADRQPIEPAPGGIELGVPRGVVDRAARVAAAPEVPVVVLGRAGLVVRRSARPPGRCGEACGRRRRPRPSAARRAAQPRRRPRSSIAWWSRNRRNPLSPALPRHVGQSGAQPSRSSGPRHVCGGPAPQAVEGRSERHDGRAVPVSS